MNQCNIPPFWGFTNFTPTIPKLYWDVESQEQRILNLFETLDKVIAYVDFVGQYVGKIESVTPSDITNLKTYIDTVKQELEKTLYELSISNLVWDCQKGKQNSSVESIRDMFNDVTVHSIKIHDFNEIENMTVAKLSECGLNVRGLAVMSRSLIDKNITVPQEFKI